MQIAWQAKARYIESRAVTGDRPDVLFKADYEETAGPGAAVHYAGQVDVAGLPRPLRNAHSGGHFSPQLNGYYAAAARRWLGDAGILAADGP